MNFIKRFKKEEKASAAVEFALIAPIFFSIIFVILETGWVAIQKSNLYEATDTISRHVYLGRARAAGVTRTELEQLVCEKTVLASRCQQNITVEMTVIDSFADIPTNDTTCREEGIPVTTEIIYENGDESDIVFIRTCLTVHTLTGIGAEMLGLSKSDNGKYQIIAKTAFVNRRTS